MLGEGANRNVSRLEGACQVDDTFRFLAESTVRILPRLKQLDFGTRATLVTTATSNEAAVVSEEDRGLRQHLPEMSPQGNFRNFCEGFT
jgi:hypothetical protein